MMVVVGCGYDRPFLHEWARRSRACSLEQGPSRPAQLEQIREHQRRKVASQRIAIPTPRCQSPPPKSPDDPALPASPPQNQGQAVPERVLSGQDCPPRLAKSGCDRRSGTAPFPGLFLKGLERVAATGPTYGRQGQDVVSTCRGGGRGVLFRCGGTATMYEYMHWGGTGGRPSASLFRMFLSRPAEISASEERR